MSKPPIPLPEINEALLRAMRESSRGAWMASMAGLIHQTPAQIKQHMELEHTNPGPSSVTKCRRAQWFPTHMPEDANTPPEEWIYAAAVGMLVEPWWRMMLCRADPRLEVTDFEEPLNIAPGVLGMPDGALENISALVEYKASGSWDYIYTKEDGLQKNHKDHIAQANLYLEGADKDWCLIIHNTVAPALVRWLKAPWVGPKGQKKRDPNFRYPFFTLNWIQRDPEYVAYLKERLVTLQEDQADEEIAPREYDPWTDRHPCQTMCRWREQCEAAG